MRSALRPILEHLPLALFLLALAVLLIGLGMVIERYRLFPRSILDDAQTTAGATLDALAGRGLGHHWSPGFSDTPLGDIPARRVEFGSLSDAMLLSGGHYWFREFCPDRGCLAVAIAPSGEIVHAWPFRANAIAAANIVDEDGYPYELNNFSNERDGFVLGVEQYVNGDLLVTFLLENAFPYGGGVARIGRDGQPRWYRRAYNHHWPRLVDGGIAYVPSYTLGEGDYTMRTGGRRVIYRCDGKHYRSAVDVIDGDGALLERIPVFDILRASGRDIFLTPSNHPCDPLHLNSVDVVGESADGAGGILPGDLILSFRGNSAFAILDGETRELKHLVRGSFHWQHDVTHLTGATFLMFDNRGAAGRQPQFSRLLMIDVATGVETVVFPNDRTPDALRGLFTRLGGSIAVSSDGRRAIASFGGEGTAVEVRLSDGAVLSVIRSLHDVSALGQFPEERHDRAVILRMPTVDYLRDEARPGR